jgi:GNAT superfamily N-acetyltransferase
MMDIEISPYSPEDDAAALALEEMCVQGTALQLKFLRPNFRARSELYENYRIYCARRDGELIGIIAGALKKVKLHGEDVLALYVYDLRVHPLHRKMGVGKRLTNALLDDLGRDADCIYTLINGENEKALNLACRNFDPKVIIPLTYALIPIYKKRTEKTPWKFEEARNVHKLFLKKKMGMEFLPSFKEERQAGYVESLALEGGAGAGCSIWTNKDLLAEQVIRIPSGMKILRILFRLLKPFVKLPHIPAPNEIIRSWFLFDLQADNSQSLKSLLAAVNNYAFARGRTYLYVLLRNNDPILRQLRESGLKFFTFPYRFLAKGRTFPQESDHIYIDIRDL